MTTTEEPALLSRVRQAVAAYNAARDARDRAIQEAAHEHGRTAAADASGLSLSRVDQLRHRDPADE